MASRWSAEWNERTGEDMTINDVYWPEVVSSRPKQMEEGSYDR